MADETTCPACKHTGGHGPDGICIGCACPRWHGPVPTDRVARSHARHRAGGTYRPVRRALQEAQRLAEKIRGRASLAEMAMTDPAIVDPPAETVQLATEALALVERLRAILAAASDPDTALAHYDGAADEVIVGGVSCGPGGCAPRGD